MLDFIVRISELPRSRVEELAAEVEASKGQ
jgi:hypothetical protein